ncbi:hypothetical protein M3G47_07660 [Corynebacterium sanguinis]|uniref:Uncharacterized protein n=1 Tax=Corynebacterium sanguinis TaxID=2594913 RepID=A0A6C1TVZ7_9CORY|nr:hypothetical protein [Corynebacterium sanguinis]MCT1411749.1 hypothetical protein [Corynebacterium sanguinis]MCT1444279.1 hypothetical protein [Corynebacterium sanguinis]MCT1463603.1 hypothetical protein [Corynebacterium sanguinis]MCT1492838.1 hypothetical protein [Corynebacterium sanguinis]MCT1628181.1 hypothetical protein [Corynebacterium sanguinis]
MPNPQRKRRRAKRTADVEYDRAADSVEPRAADDEFVVLDDDVPPPLSDLEYYEDERPPHYGS